MSSESALSPLLLPADQPYGLPDLSAVTVEDLELLIESAIRSQRQAWEQIAENEAPVSFETVVDPLERAAARFCRATGILHTFSGSMGEPEVLALQKRWAGALAEHESAAARNPRLAEKIAAVPEEGLDDEQRHVLRRWRESFEDQGAFVSVDQREELARIDEEIARLCAEFGTRLLKGAAEAALVVDAPEELAGLSEAEIAHAAEAATAAGHEGSYLVGLDLFASPSLLPHLSSRETRRKLYLNSINRGRGPARDEGAAETPETLSLGARIAELRDRRAKIFGARNHAELALRRTVAGSVERAVGLLEQLVPRALANFRRELEVMSEVSGMPVEQIRPWDVPVLLDQVARQRYDVDVQALLPYFEFERTLKDGVFAAASELYGLRFIERPELPGYHPEVRFWEVADEDGSVLGLFGLDPWARPTKQGGAWMHEILGYDPEGPSRTAGADHQTPVVMNTLNLTAPGPDAPKLLTPDNVRTMFHEFGHALHGLLTRVGYPSVAGTNVPRDFVEYPSQVNEMWMFHPEVVSRYARHHQTGRPLPPQQIAALNAAKQWGEGFRTSEYLGAALLDMAWHTRGADAPQIRDAQAARNFEESVLARYGFTQLPLAPRYATGMFKHIFNGGYSAGYYSYLFSEMMDAETVDWFEQHGGLRRENGEIFRKRLLSRGSSQDPAQSFRDLIGRDPQIEPLLRRRGLES